MAVSKGTDKQKLTAVARGKTKVSDLTKGSGPISPSGRGALTKGQPGNLKTAPRKATDKAPAPPGPNTPAGGGTVTPPTSPLVAPFLTPDQQQQMNDAWVNYQTARNAATGNIEVARANYYNGQQQAGQQHLVNSAKTNEAMAARGLFESSIRAGALNDIDATLAMQQNLLRTQWNTTYLKNMQDIGIQDVGWGNRTGISDVQQVQNAAGQTPVLPDKPLPVNGLQTAGNQVGAAGSTESAAQGEATGKTKNTVADAGFLQAQAQQRAGAATPPTGAPSTITKGAQGPTLSKVAKGGAKLNGS